MRRNITAAHTTVGRQITHSTVIVCRRCARVAAAPAVCPAVAIAGAIGVAAADHQDCHQKQREELALRPTPLLPRRCCRSREGRHGGFLPDGGLMITPAPGRAVDDRAPLAALAYAWRLPRGHRTAPHRTRYPGLTIKHELNNFKAGSIDMHMWVSTDTHASRGCEAPCRSVSTSRLTTFILPRLSIDHHGVQGRPHQRSRPHCRGVERNVHLLREH